MACTMSSRSPAGPSSNPMEIVPGVIVMEHANAVICQSFVTRSGYATTLGSSFLLPVSVSTSTSRDANNNWPINQAE